MALLVDKIHPDRPLPHLTDDEIIEINRLYFRNFPDPTFIHEVREATTNPLVRSALMGRINQQRKRRGQPPITYTEFDRLAGLFRESLGG